MEMQGTQNGQNDFEKEEQNWRTHSPNFKIFYTDTYSNQNYVVVA